MTDTTEALSAELVPGASQLVVPGGGAVAAAAAPLLPVAERYAASQAAPSTRRTHRSTLRCFALFCEHELQLPATVGRITLDTVLDYTGWLQDLDEETDEPRCHPRTVAKQLSAIRGLRALAGDGVRAARRSAHPADPRQGRTAAGAAGADARAAAHAAAHARPRDDPRGRRDCAILEVLARAGLRRSELCALRWDDVVEVPRWSDPRLRDAVAERPADETAWALRVEHSKRGRGRLVPLGRPVVTASRARALRLCSVIFVAAVGPACRGGASWWWMKRGWFRPASSRSSSTRSNTWTGRSC
jgi:integrase